MKKRIAIIIVFMASALAFSCTEEVVPTAQPLDQEQPSLQLDDQKSTDGEEEEGEGYDPHIG